MYSRKTANFGFYDDSGQFTEDLEGNIIANVLKNPLRALEVAEIHNLRRIFEEQLGTFFGVFYLKPCEVQVYAMNFHSFGWGIVGN